MDKKRWQELQEFANKNKDLLVMFASPREDSVFVSFGLTNGFFRFPTGDMKDGVVFNALRKSKFEEAIDPFMAGFMDTTGIDEKNGVQLIKVMGGAMKGIGEQREIIKDNIKKNGKTKSK
jgi:hypothetical protein